MISWIFWILNAWRVFWITKLNGVKFLKLAVAKLESLKFFFNFENSIFMDFCVFIRVFDGRIGNAEMNINVQIQIFFLR